MARREVRRAVLRPARVRRERRHRPGREPATSRATTSARSSTWSRRSVGSGRTRPATRGWARSAAATAAGTSSSAPSRSSASTASRSSTRSPPRSPGTTSTAASRRRASCAPSGRSRSRAAGLPTQALSPAVYQALVQGAATGFWPDGSLPVPGTPNMEEFFERNGPRYHVSQGRRLDIPVLFGQGTTDSLFNLQQGLDNWRTAITRKARRHSIFVGYNGGHVLPAVYPTGVTVTSDPCSKQLAGGDFSDARAAVHGREPQAPRHRPPGLRPAPPGHARLDLYDGQAGDRRHRGTPSARSPPPRPAAPLSPSRSRRDRSASPGRRTSPGPSPRSASTTGRSTDWASGPLRSTPHSCRTT